jgi:hypothetical protein
MALSIAWMSPDFTPLVAAGSILSGLRTTWADALNYPGLVNFQVLTNFPEG